ncbi:DUF1003 domain-containing protein [Burkholderia ubonensis]|uniref:DUF1003 domain-containing protein n=1 Tax=Burkholderia ubonensis TaxID=101571 RepID=UPI000759B590|nr:DUF1003 domain-containing protein [Burkholderia ubonensis]KVC81372.1 hypothetical protein WI75_08450 [Burkholderia ubonensis]
MKPTIGQRAADAVAASVGSWTFLIAFNIGMAVWCAVNLALGSAAFDPAPFIGLNLLLSWLAGVQAPVIMISQNRQEEIGRETQLAILRLLQAQQNVMQQQIDHIATSNELLAQTKKAVSHLLKLAEAQGVMLEQILEEVEEDGSESA